MVHPIGQAHQIPVEPRNVCENAYANITRRIKSVKVAIKKSYCFKSYGIIIHDKVYVKYQYFYFTYINVNRTLLEAYIFQYKTDNGEI